MKKSKKSSPKVFMPKKIIWGILIIVFIYILAVLWPIRSFIFSGFLSGKTLILITNENEARPCGGFLSAFAIAKTVPPSLDFRDSYTLKNFDFGNAEPPLDKVSDTKNFWDLAILPNLEACAQSFETAYEQATSENIDHVLLFDFGTIEEIFKIFGEDYFFASTSRNVANVDRHDEESLAHRKDPTNLKWKLIKKTLLNPSILPRITRIIGKNILNGKLYSPEISPEIKPEQDDFYVSEWNLGGAKSSRYLKKILFISARENMPNKWQITMKFSVQHLGGIDEPLSQEWKGVFEIHVPGFLESKPFIFDTKLQPGDSLEKEFFFDYEGDFKRFSVFVPRGQELFADLSVSLFPQKIFDGKLFKSKENTGRFFGEIIPPRQIFDWNTLPDNVPPFVTLHEIIPYTLLENSSPELVEEFKASNLIAEIHFNERIVIPEDFSAKLIDRNFENKEVSEDLESITFKLLEDERTLILGFSQNTKQLNERFFIKFTKSIYDLFGNKVIASNKTLIDRIKSR